ncbi:hypothetical protein V6N13_112079 [Hibiscus sabdariffa]|uniref:Uncharacterized protein n=1 Tax=Hibiscus sabdariffa TaxID=183260 RepID=A0ABR2TM56_9ROSI
MGKQAKNGTGRKQSAKESGSSWSPAMDGIPEPSSVDQTLMEARSRSYERRRLKAFKEICPELELSKTGIEEATSRK